MNEQYTDHEITEAMQVFGGGFVSRLGTLWRLADRDNQQKLKTCFVNYWTEYANPVMHERLRKIRNR